MDIIKECESVLNHYRGILVGADTLKKRIDKLVKKAGPNEIKGISYEDVGKGSPDQLEAVEFFSTLCLLKKDQEETEEEARIITETLATLTKEHRELIEDYYIKKISLEDIAAKQQVSLRTIHRNKKEAIKSFAVRYFGAKVLNVSLSS